MLSIVLKSLMMRSIWWWHASSTYLCFGNSRNIYRKKQIL